MKGTSMKKLISPASVLTVALVVLMAGASELLHEPEIVFPEITAMAIGAWLAPKTVWRTNRLRLFAMTSLCAVCGVLIVRYCQVPLFFQLLLAFVFSQALLLASGTGFAPMTSAIVLPVLLGTSSWVYPVSAVVMTGCIVVLQVWLERRGEREPQEFTPVRPSLQTTFLRVSPFYKRILVAAALFLLSALSGWRFIAAPPLIVAFIELSNPASKARTNPVKTVLFVILCTLSGSVARFVFCVLLGLPLTAAVFVVAVLLVIGIYKTRFFFPPAGAMAVLPFLAPEQTLLYLPVQAAAGMVLLMGAALFVFPEARRIPVGQLANLEENFE